MAVYIESPYKILHASKNFFFHFHGQDEVKFRAFPLANHHTLSSEHADVLEIECNGRQQLISAGYANVLQYTYLWESELSNISQLPSISVTDVRGNDIPPGELIEMPPDKLLSVTAQYDGSVIISKKSGMEKRTIHAGHTIEIDQLQKNTCIQIQQGLDVLYTLVVCPIVEKSDENEKSVLFHLMHSSGRTVKVPHSIGATAKYLAQYPQIKAWLMVAIADGAISEKALKHYQSFIHSITK